MFDHYSKVLHDYSAGNIEGGMDVFIISG